MSPITNLNNSSTVLLRYTGCTSRRWAGHVARMEEGRSALKILAGKPTGNRPLGRPRRRWEDNIRIYLKEIGIQGIGLIWLRIGITGGACECGIEAPGP